MKSLVLSSGFGTRLYPLTLTVAKGLLEYQGRPLIDYVIDKIPQDIDILVNINKKFEEDFRRWQENVPRKIKICVEPVYNEGQSFGAIGSITYWIKNEDITEDLLVLASDNYFEFDLLKFIRNFNGRNTLVAVQDIGDVRLASKYGVVQLDDSRIIRFEEKPQEPKSSLIATACWVLPSRVFRIMFQYSSAGKQDNLGDFITYLIEEVKEDVYAFPFTERWMDIGSIEVYEALQLEDNAD
ncbi:MAG TPA: nucleotidyltransferase family protein [Dehalococcoidia bacterium]|nr:nucleotidyltransferase family protein [Dehalococcoidia bacterium]